MSQYVSTTHCTTYIQGYNLYTLKSGTDRTYFSVLYGFKYDAYCIQSLADLFGYNHWNENKKYIVYLFIYYLFIFILQRHRSQVHEHSFNKINNSFINKISFQIIKINRSKLICFDQILTISLFLLSSRVISRVVSSRGYAVTRFKKYIALRICIGYPAYNTRKRGWQYTEIDTVLFLFSARRLTRFFY